MYYVATNLQGQLDRCALYGSVRYESLGEILRRKLLSFMREEKKNIEKCLDIRR